MEAGESIEETMIREVFEETGLKVRRHELYTIYSGSCMKYKYPDGNEVVFVMFIFNAEVDFKWRIASDNKTLIYHDQNQESLQLEFKSIEDIEIEEISTVQRPLFEDLKQQVTTLLRS